MTLFHRSGWGYILNILVSGLSGFVFNSTISAWSVPIPFHVTPTCESFIIMAYTVSQSIIVDANMCYQNTSNFSNMVSILQVSSIRELVRPSAYWSNSIICCWCPKPQHTTCIACSRSWWITPEILWNLDTGLSCKWFCSGGTWSSSREGVEHMIPLGQTALRMGRLLSLAHHVPILELIYLITGSLLPMLSNYCMPSYIASMPTFASKISWCSHSRPTRALALEWLTCFPMEHTTDMFWVVQVTATSVHVSASQLWLKQTWSFQRAYVSWGSEAYHVVDLRCSYRMLLAIFRRGNNMLIWISLPHHQSTTLPPLSSTLVTIYPANGTQIFCRELPNTGLKNCDPIPALQWSVPSFPNYMNLDTKKSGMNSIHSTLLLD